MEFEHRPVVAGHEWLRPGNHHKHDHQLDDHDDLLGHDFEHVEHDDYRLLWADDDELDDEHLHDVASLPVPTAHLLRHLELRIHDHQLYAPDGRRRPLLPDHDDDGWRHHHDHFQHHDNRWPYYYHHAAARLHFRLYLALGAGVWRILRLAPGQQRLLLQLPLLRAKRRRLPLRVRGLAVRPSSDHFSAASLVQWLLLVGLGSR